MKYIFVTTYSTNGEKLYMTEDLDFSPSITLSIKFDSKEDCKSFLSRRFLTLSDKILRLNLKTGVFITIIDGLGKVIEEDRFI